MNDHQASIAASLRAIHRMLWVVFITMCLMGARLGADLPPLNWRQVVGLAQPAEQHAQTAHIP